MVRSRSISLAIRESSQPVLSARVYALCVVTYTHGSAKMLLYQLSSGIPKEDSHYPLRPDTTSPRLLHIPRLPTRHYQRYDTIHSRLRNRSLELASRKHTSQLKPISHLAQEEVGASVSG